MNKLPPRSGWHLSSFFRRRSSLFDLSSSRPRRWLCLFAFSSASVCDGRRALRVGRSSSDLADCSDVVRRRRLVAVSSSSDDVRSTLDDEDDDDDRDRDISAVRGLRTRLSLSRQAAYTFMHNVLLFWGSITTDWMRAAYSPAFKLPRGGATFEMRVKFGVVISPRQISALSVQGLRKWKCYPFKNISFMQRCIPSAIFTKCLAFVWVSWSINY